MVGVYLLPGTGGPAIKFSLGPKRSPLSDQPSLFPCDPAQTRLLPRKVSLSSGGKKLWKKEEGKLKTFSSLLYLKMSAEKKKNGGERLSFPTSARSFRRKEEEIMRDFATRKRKERRRLNINGRKR